MKTKLPCYLRTYRRRAGLRQKQLALLLGLDHQTSISKLERRVRNPNLQIVFGCQLLFGVPAAYIFPEAVQQIKRDIVARLHQHALLDNITADGLSDSPLTQTLYENNSS